MLNTKHNELDDNFHDKIASASSWVAIQAKSGSTSRRLQLAAGEGRVDIFTSNDNWESYDSVKIPTEADLTDGINTKISVAHLGGANTRMVLDCTSPNEGYVGLEGKDGAWYRRLKFLTDGRIIYAYKLTEGTEKTKVISEAPT